MAQQTNEATPFQQKWQGRWKQFSGKVKSLWGNLIDDKGLETEGEFDRVLGDLQTRTGKTREQLEEMIGD